jgi:hypothetical protein
MEWAVAELTEAVGSIQPVSRFQAVFPPNSGYLPNAD